MPTALLLSLGGLAIALAVLVWVVTKTARPDGTFLGPKIHPYRRMMPIIMPTKAESIVFFDAEVNATKLEAFLHARPELTMTHMLVAAAARTMHQSPRINRFVAGGRLYQRCGVWVTFSMKRQKSQAEAKIATVKLEIPEDQTLDRVRAQVDGSIKVERSEEETYLDKELSLFLRLPHVVLQLAQRAMSWANAHHFLPASFLKNDSLFTSVVLANLGSLGMRAGYHHLYEWGNCPLFVMVGKVEPRPAVDEQGELCVRRILPMRFTFDERIEDGLSAKLALGGWVAMLEDPETHFP